MFGLGHWEILAICAVVLLIFGSRLPAAARGLGMSFRAFRLGARGAELDEPEDVALRRTEPCTKR